MSGLPPLASAGTEGWSDERLVKECLEGHETAWVGLIAKYKALIYSIPIRYGMSPDDASEIFQQICAMLVEQLPNLREPSTMGAWLIKVTSRKCIDWSRRQKRYQPIDEDRSDGYAAAISEPSDVLLFELEREQILREALLAIDSRCRELIRMLFFETPAKPYEEVARSLGLATGSIGFVRMRCLQRLRRLLEKARLR